LLLLLLLLLLLRLLLEMEATAVPPPLPLLPLVEEPACVGGPYTPCDIVSPESCSVAPGAAAVAADCAAGGFQNPGEDMPHPPVLLWLLVEEAATVPPPQLLLPLR
jgi:hypothetical protein